MTKRMTRADELEFLREWVGKAISEMALMKAEIMRLQVIEARYNHVKRMAVDIESGTPCEDFDEAVDRSAALHRLMVGTLQ